jgi:hypothetical protein
LLNKDPSKRLGSHGGASEIKKHPFFAEIDWNAMMRKKIPPPYKPQLDCAEDTRHFDTDICNIPIESPPAESKQSYEEVDRDSN